jgi:hypothetical protein
MEKCHFIRLLTDDTPEGPTLSVLSKLLIHNHPVLPPPIGRVSPHLHHGFNSAARLTAIGIGRDGARMAAFLSKNQPNLECYEIYYSQRIHKETQPSTLYLSIMNSDLIFVMFGSDVGKSYIQLQAICDLSTENNIPTIGIHPYGPTYPAIRDCTDYNFRVSAESISSTKGKTSNSSKTLSMYAGRHIIQVMTDMITQRSLICVDFNDIKTVLNYGKIGLLGTGVATGPDAGRQATALAMDRILAQGCKLEKAKGALLIMQGSSFLKIENFEGMTYSALKYLSIEDKIVLGLTQNDELGYNVKVSVLIVM